jgi:hypothetical protein
LVDRCGFCGGTDGPFTRVEGAFTVLSRPAAWPTGPAAAAPPPTPPTKSRAGLDQLPSWVLAQKAAANRRVIAVMRGRLERGERVVPTYGPLGLAWLQRQPRSPSSSSGSERLVDLREQALRSPPGSR